MTETKDYTKRSVEEARTHELFDFGSNGIEWTPNMAVLANVWRAMYSSALPVTRIQIIAAAIACYKMDGLDPNWLRKELTALVRAKILRSYHKQGQYLYEVNY
jgi:hypothetical protein